MTDKANSEIAQGVVDKWDATEVDNNDDLALSRLVINITDLLDAKDEAAATPRSKAFDDAIAIVERERERERVLSITERTSYGDGRLDAASILAGALTAARDKKAEVEKENNDAKV